MAIFMMYLSYNFKSIIFVSEFTVTKMSRTKKATMKEQIYIASTELHTLLYFTSYFFALFGIARQNWQNAIIEVYIYRRLFDNSYLVFHFLFTTQHIISI